MPVLDVSPNLQLNLKLSTERGLADLLTQHLCTCDDCRLGSPPRRLCAVAETLILRCVSIEVIDGSDSD